ncbi:UDP-glucose 4-epimerase GalE [Arthrobacter sp. ISL-72]|uniref:UDP-glucose 4-epimerase GalE n=1 Tax=Arthrobacter sp. ISL-72 TaxID=2819114 RepID=UPI001BEA99AC|nr:UDP-glucose 4-epimerase GalE [Arthrobacter sp. ISL-72]MBT2594848.1 UDP-glucose 4-epimerase GalE [Arthrobacter sp. ISL-72]
MGEYTVLVTGGTGFIGSHCCRDLLDNGYDVVIVDNLVNSSGEVIDRILELGNGNLYFYCLDVNDSDALARVFQRHAVDVVVHFAAHKAVRDSVGRPLEYYTNNVSGLLSLLAAMQSVGVQHLIFSSSCSIYGDSNDSALTEASPPSPTNPYARSKWMCEVILEDFCSQRPAWSVTALRYFNPAGAHSSGLLGEAPKGVPSNIVPFLAQLAAGRREVLEVFGCDYPTPDGTAIRDYIHVSDVVEGHRLALERGPDSGFRRYNLGTGVGTSVLELISEFEIASGRRLPYRLMGRRPGDVPQLVASPALARAELGWVATRTLTDMCRDSWRFQVANPSGYGALSPGARSEA